MLGYSIHPPFMGMVMEVFGVVTNVVRSLCSGQLIPDTDLSFSSASTGAIPPLKACGRSVL